MWSERDGDGYCDGVAYSGSVSHSNSLWYELVSGIELVEIGKVMRHKSKTWNFGCAIKFREYL